MNDTDAPRWLRFEPPLLPQGGDLSAFLDRTFPGVVATGVEFIDEGVVNSNYRVELRWPAGTAGPDRVRLRLSRSDEGALREGAIGERLASVLPGLAPRLLATERGTSPEPHRRSLFSWIDGRPLSECGALAEAQGARAAQELGEALATLHRVDPGAFGGLDAAGHPAPARSAARWTDTLCRRVAVRLENPAHGLVGERLERVRSGFARLLSPLWGRPGPAPALVHGDLSPGNIILEPGTPGRPPGLAGLVDWEMACGADPAADLASLRIEAPPALQHFVREVEGAYREAVVAAVGESALAEWPRRVALAAVPGLLDARMVAVRRGAEGVLSEIDHALASALDAGKAPA